MSDDLLTIMWNKIAALTGGSAEWPIGLGLRPWYLKVAIAPFPAWLWITELCSAQVVLACIRIAFTLVRLHCCRDFGAPHSVALCHVTLHIEGATGGSPVLGSVKIRAAD